MSDFTEDDVTAGMKAAERWATWDAIGPRMQARIILESAAPAIAARARQEAADELLVWINHEDCDIPEWHNGMLSAYEIIQGELFDE